MDGALNGINRPNIIGLTQTKEDPHIRIPRVPSRPDSEPSMRDKGRQWEFHVCEQDHSIGLSLGKR
jgi:hypothetical protein